MGGGGSSSRSRCPEAYTLTNRVLFDHLKTDLTVRVWHGRIERVL